MSISFVNGYLCFCSCDVAKARKGEDPKKASDPDAQDLKEKQGQEISGASRSGQAAVVFGGALTDLTSRVTPTDDAYAAVAANRQNYGPSVDLLI
jgi:hypothetical protein